MRLSRFFSPNANTISAKPDESCLVSGESIRLAESVETLFVLDGNIL
jgi:hypothetical protein